MKPSNRTELMQRLGAVQVNHVWSWCAVNEAKKEVYFSMWEDTREVVNGKVSYIVQEPCWGTYGGSRTAARNDHDEKLAKVFHEGYKAFGYINVAENTKAQPRKIECTRTSFVFSIDVERQEDGTILGFLKKRIEIK